MPNGSSAERERTGRHFEPDLYVVPAVEGRRPRADVPVTTLLLAVEVLSPSSVRHDRITKRKFFQAHGIPEYWVVDGGAEAFEVWRPGDDRPQLLDDLLRWQPAPAHEEFRIDVRQFFEGIADDLGQSS